MAHNIKKFKRGWLGGKTNLTITSPYGYRKHPTYKIRKFHHGNDIAVPVGTAIYAPCKGTIIKKHVQKNGAGLYIVLKSDDGYNFYFMHLSKVVKSSGGVEEGTLIAYTGGKRGDPNAGTSTGPHLHFECRTGNGSSTSIDTRHWITDKWYCSKNGRTIVTGLKSVPLISKSESEYTEAEKEERTTSINDATLAIDSEYDSSDETEWDKSEVEIILNKQLNEGLAAGIWQIIKLAMDSNVANLRVRDAATSLQQGSLINFFQKMCQEPFAEFFGDTYGDQYYFIVRKPPFDKDGMLKTMLTEGLFSQSGENNDNKIQISEYDSENKSVYMIDEDDIISSNISFNTQGIYSWYQFVPIYELGTPADLQYLIPAVLFPEYAAVWGSRSLTIRSQYRDFINSVINDEVKNGEKSKQGDAEVRHSIHDLKYIIESNAYNPFVRQGTIQITGNRKFKRGTFVRIKWNSIGSEIFFIENVSQNYSVSNNSVQRTTTLTLSRGMMYNFMFTNESNTISRTNKKNEDKSIQISYFNLIDFGDYENKKDNITMDDWRNIISSWKVNTEVFNFFLRKMQFINLNKLEEVTVLSPKNNRYL